MRPAPLRGPLLCFKLRSPAPMLTKRMMVLWYARRPSHTPAVPLHLLPRPRVPPRAGARPAPRQPEFPDTCLEHAGLVKAVRGHARGSPRQPRTRQIRRVALGARGQHGLARNDRQGRPANGPDKDLWAGSRGHHRWRLSSIRASMPSQTHSRLTCR